MRTLLKRAANAIAPKVCPACEGGSGTVLDCERGFLRVCDYCAGSGRASDNTLLEDLRSATTAALEPVSQSSHRSPGSAA
jgi:hypothetical protein